MPPPDVIAFAQTLADVALDLRRGNNCLITADKAWTQPFYLDLRQRLRHFELRCEYIDGRPPGEGGSQDIGVMLTAITHLRLAVRASVEGVVIVLPHLDVMTTSDGGWTNISREMVPLLYESPEAVLLGFRDPSMPLLPVVTKLFGSRYDVAEPYPNVPAPPPTAPPDAAPPAARDEQTRFQVSGHQVSSRHRTAFILPRKCTILIAALSLTG